MTMHSSSARGFLALVCIAMPVVAAADARAQDGAATSGADASRDEFGLPLPAARIDSAPGTTAVQRWKREAVAISAQEDRVERSRALSGAGERDNAYTAFGAAFTEAKVPDCLREDGLKRQPPRILFFAFQGVLALPFVALAKVRGKCL